MNKHCIEKTISNSDYQKLFKDIYSSAIIWNKSDDESDEEDSSSNYYTEYSDNMVLFVSKWWNEREKHINTDYTVTGWMLYIILHIRDYVLKFTK